MAEKYISRVNQLDALHLDKEIKRTLHNDLILSIEKILPNLLIRLKPEIELIFETLIWYGSIGRRFSTFGQDLFLLAYDKHQLTLFILILHYSFTILTKYIKENIQQRFTEKQDLQNFVGYIENFKLFLDSFNFLRFLKTGKYPTLIDFILRLNYILKDVAKRREITYNHMNKELLWGGFMELLGVVFPLVNVQKCQRIAKNFLLRRTNKNNSTIQPLLTLETLCSICKDRPTLPHHIGCEHIFCYYCIKGSVLADSGFECPMCYTKASVISKL